jgi:hypothetical protein
MWPAAALATDGAWFADSYPDPFNDGASIVKAERATQSADGKMLRALVRCWTVDRSLDARFFVRGSGRALSGDVEWQFDDGSTRRGRWEVNPQGNQIIVPPAIEAEFLEQLRQRFQLQLRLTDSDGGEHAFLVPLRGTLNAVGGVLEACRR